MPYSKGRLLRDGGEGYIYETRERPDLLLKIYKEKDMSGAPVVTPELQSKLEYMKDNPPEGLVSRKIVAWPIELIKDENNKLLGFVMPKLDLDEHILRTYSYRHPEIDKAEYRRFPSVESRIKIGMNLCSAMNELHRKKYVIGDFNHENIGVNYKTGQIYFMDCDSFHIVDEQNRTFRTNVIMAGYLAPEIIQRCNKERSKGNPYNLDKVALPTFTKYSDRFCLALHLFKLLMNGVDPFRGIKSEATGSTASPFVGNEAVERNAYVFGKGNKPSAVFCPPADSLPPEILSLFNKAFIDGREDPTKRPSETVWYNALNKFLTKSLKKCPENDKHQFYRSLYECPYCIADEKHFKVQNGIISRTYRDKPEDVRDSSPPVLIKKSKRQTRKLHIIVSLVLWISAVTIYYIWNYIEGNRSITLNPADWSGYEFVFILAAFIEFSIEILFCRKELVVLNDNIDLREIDPKFIDIDLRAYKKKLNNKIKIMIVAATLSIILFLVIYGHLLF